MASLMHIIYSIKEQLSGFRVTDDIVYNNEFLKYKINSARELLIEREYRKGNISQEFYQLVCCLEVKCNPQGCYINGVFVPSGSVYSYVELPELITSIGDANIIYFGLDDLHTPFSRMNFQAFMTSYAMLYTSDKPIYTVVDNIAIVKNLPNNGIRYLCMLGLLKDPTKNCEWNDDTVEYPVPNTYELEMLVRQDILQTYSIIGDELHDARDIKGVMRSNQKANTDDTENENAEG